MRHIQVKLAWDLSGVDVANGQATFRTDAGYVVEIDRFELTSFSFELMPCEQRRPPRPPGPPGAAPRPAALSVMGAILTTPALAGHETGHPPTRTYRPQVEAPLVTPTTVLDRITPPDIAYCSAHYLIARVPESATEGAGKENVGLSLRIHGRARKATEDSWSPVDLESSVAHGILTDFNPATPKKGIRIAENDTIVVTRRLSNAFDGVDFAAMDSATTARQILRQVVAGTRLSQQADHPAGT